MTSTVSQTLLSTWRENITRSIAKSRKVRGSNYVQIATVDSDNKPRNRTVVFRGFISDSKTGHEAFKMITDARSHKVKNIVDHTSWCEMVWWFSKTSEQYRILGKLKLVRESDRDEQLLQARKQQWGNLSDAAREQFFWEQPGDTYSGEETEKNVPKGGRNIETNRVLPPPDNFLLLLLYPTEVKYLNLRSNFSQLDKLDFQEPSNPSSTSTISRRNNEHDDKEILNKDTQEPSDQISVSREENIEWKWRSIRVNP